MECIVEQQHEQITEAPETDGAKLLVELLDASLAVEEESSAAAGPGRGSNQQLGLFPADDGCWLGSLQEELNYSSIHAHLQEEEDCEDCGLDGILLQSGFEGCRCSASPPPYANEPVEHWMDEMALGPFDGECVGEWYMDGMAMDSGWDDGRSYYSFCYPAYGGEACAEQFYNSPLWE